MALDLRLGPGASCSLRERKAEQKLHTFTLNPCVYRHYYRRIQDSSCSSGNTLPNESPPKTSSTSYGLQDLAKVGQGLRLNGFRQKLFRRLGLGSRAGPRRALRKGIRCFEEAREPRNGRQEP